MKAKTHFRNLLSFLFIISLASCEGLIDDIIEPIDDSELQVTTNFPEISQSNVVFKGEVNNISNGENVEYGFMWYNSTEEDPTVYRIVLGRRTTNGTFSFAIDNLPKNEALVVCAYAVDPSPYENEVVGEERDFDWSL